MSIGAAQHAAAAADHTTPVLSGESLLEDLPPDVIAALQPYFYAGWLAGLASARAAARQRTRMHVADGGLCLGWCDPRNMGTPAPLPRTQTTDVASRAPDQ